MFFVRPRRILKGMDTEVWSMEYNGGNGFVAEDAMVIHFTENKVYAWLVVKDESRQSIEEYSSYAYAVIGGTDENDQMIELITIVDPHVEEYSPEELIMIVQEYKTSRQEICELFYDGDDPVFLRLRDGYTEPILPEEKEKILSFSRKLCRDIKLGDFDREDLLLIFQMINDLGNHPESIEAVDLFNHLLKDIKYILSDS